MDIKQKLLDFGGFEINEYFNKYVELISQNTNREQQQFITNKHHIIPKSYYIKKKIEIDNSNLNLVNLLYKDHALGHYYLCLCTKDSYLKYSGISAIQHILGMKYFPKDEKDIINKLSEYQHLYEFKCKQHAYIMKGKLSGANNPAKRLDVRKKISESKLGHVVTLETRNKISAANSGQKRSRYNYTKQGRLSMSTTKLGELNPAKRPEIRKRNSEAHKGKIRITNGIENKTISPDELDFYILKGYYRGLTRHIN